MQCERYFGNSPLAWAHGPGPWTHAQGPGEYHGPVRFGWVRYRSRLGRYRDELLTEARRGLAVVHCVRLAIRELVNRSL